MGESPSLCASGTLVVDLSGCFVLSFIGFSGLWRDEGDDIIAARISFVCDGVFGGDLFSVKLEMCGLGIDLSDTAGGVTITCISGSCSSAWCTGE